MRRKEREITSYERMLEIVEACDCCRIGLADEGGPYIVPLNFGHEDKDGQLVLYFHGAKEGKKIDLIRRQPTVGFEMDGGHELEEGKIGCGYSYLYQSVIGKGRLEILEDEEEKRHGLQRVMEHYTGKADWDFTEKVFERTGALKLTVTQWSCKEHRSMHKKEQ